MKKIFAIFLTLALTCATLAACGTKPANSNEILLADKLRDNSFDTIYVELELAGLTKEQKQELTGLCTQQLTEAYGSDVEVILYFAEDDPDGTLKKEMQKCPNTVCTFPDQEQVDKSLLDLLKVALAIVERIIEEINRVLATLGRPAIGGERTEATQGSTGATNGEPTTITMTTEVPTANSIDLGQYFSVEQWDVKIDETWLNHWACSITVSELAKLLGCTKIEEKLVPYEYVVYEANGVRFDSLPSEGIETVGVIRWTNPGIIFCSLKIGDPVSAINETLSQHGIGPLEDDPDNNRYGSSLSISYEDGKITKFSIFSSGFVGEPT